MAFDVFLKLEGIEGESQDAKHKGEIQLESFSWGASNAGTAGTGDKGGGQISFQDFSFTSKVGTQSSQLFTALVRSRNIPTGTLTVNNGKEVETVIVLSDVLVSSYKEDASLPAVQCDRDDQNNQSKAPTESVSLNFAKIEFKSS
jgi:type VI secretion system secreted protein Hcp